MVTHHYGRNHQVHASAEGGPGGGSIVRRDFGRVFIGCGRLGGGKIERGRTRDRIRRRLRLAGLCERQSTGDENQNRVCRRVSSSHNTPLNTRPSMLLL